MTEANVNDKGEILEALDTLAMAWLEYRTGDAARETAVAFINDVMESAEPEVEPEPRPESDRWYRIVDAARSLDVNPATFGHWVTEGLVPSRNDGIRPQINGKDVERVRALLLAKPDNYTSAARYVAKHLRMEKFGDARARLPYPSQNKERRTA